MTRPNIEDDLTFWRRKREELLKRLLEDDATLLTLRTQLSIVKIAIALLQVQARDIAA